MDPEKQVGMRTLGLDEIDKRIIYELERDCGESIQKISSRLGISKRILEYRMNRLISKGVIIGFVAVLDYSKLGLMNHEVWIQLRELDPERKESLREYFIANPDIGWVAECGGKFDYGIGIMVDNVITFSNVLRKILADNPDMIHNYHITISTRIAGYPRSYLLEGRDSHREAKSFFSGPLEKSELDDLDKKIISLLSRNAKMSAVEIAAKSGNSANTIRSRIAKLERSGIIRGYKAIVQPSAMGIKNYEILINTNCITPAQEDLMKKHCIENPYVTFMISCIGNWDLNLALDARNSEHFQQMLTKIRTKFGSLIRDFEYVPIIKVHKFDFRFGVGQA